MESSFSIRIAIKNHSNFFFIIFVIDFTSTLEPRNRSRFFLQEFTCSWLLTRATHIVSPPAPTLASPSKALQPVSACSLFPTSSIHPSKCLGEISNRSDARSSFDHP